jgi:phosphoribosylformylglycinamidine cyclo-ligase
MCVNDVLTSGAEPLFFLDYLATSKLEPPQLADVVAGIAQGCQQANCALLGGETAEMPGFYAPGEYDLAGFCVGVVEKQRILDGQQIRIGDGIVGLGSQGVHSNGYSLVRKVVAEASRSDRTTPGFDWQERPEELGGATLGEVFLAPTQIYVKSVLGARQAGLDIRGMAHITGGGLPENLPRCLGPDQAIQITPDSWPVLPVFQWLARVGQIPLPEMFNTFNMGIGFALVLPPNQVEGAIAWFSQQGIPAHAIGHIIPGQGELVGLPEGAE